MEAGAHEACVVGIDDPEWGQGAAAAVVGPITPEELEYAIRGFLAGYKVPKRWLAVEELPRNASARSKPTKSASLFTA